MLLPCRIAYCLAGFALVALTAHAQEARRPSLGAPQAVTQLPPASPQPDVPTPIDAPKAEEPKSAWLTHPRYRVIPPPGFATTLPTGPGYYSLLDVLNGDYREAPPKSGYPRYGLMPPPFFDADFRYVDDPKYNPDFFERLHRVHLGDNWLFGTGGQAWWRHMRELGSRFSGKNNEYDLLRARVYGDLWYQDRFRIFAEFISAGSINEDLPPLRIDENRADLQNLFIDVKLFEIGCNPVYARVGRQELLLGSQRLISPPDWANIRRNFQGVRAFWASEKLDIDAFWVRPILADKSHFDDWDEKQNFYGAWITYRPKKGHFLDLYYLFLDNDNRSTQLGLTFAPTRVHTVGSRYTGRSDGGFLWDFEGMYQFGDRGASNISAGSATAGLGYHWKCGPMTPTFWAYYDWASGDSTPNAGDYNTFNQLFPFGHYYFGWLDLIGRQNIRDINFHMYLYPTKWITFNAQYHCFQLDRARDALYGVAGTPSRVSLAGTAGGNVGQELDLIMNFHVGPRSDIMTGWSKLYAGDFIRNTGSGRSPELFYLMYNVRW